MCDPGEKISQTLKREFMEEATDSTGTNKSNLKEIENHLNSFFEKGVEVIILSCYFIRFQVIKHLIYSSRFIEDMLMIREIPVLLSYCCC